MHIYCAHVDKVFGIRVGILPNLGEDACQHHKIYIDLLNCDARDTKVASAALEAMSVDGAKLQPSDLQAAGTGAAASHNSQLAALLSNAADGSPTTQPAAPLSSSPNSAAKASPGSPMPPGSPGSNLDKANAGSNVEPAADVEDAGGADDLPPFS